MEVTGNVTRLKGLIAEVYETMSRVMDFKYETTLQPDLKYGAKLPDGTWSGMIGAIVANETDLAGPFFMNEQRATVVDFSVPIGFSQLVLATGLEPTQKSPFLIFEIFPNMVWLLIALSVILAALIATVIYLVWPNHSKRSMMEVFSKYIWTFFVSLLGRDIGKQRRWYLSHVRKTASFRFLEATFLLLLSVILMSIYRGVIVSTLASDKLQPIVKNTEELTQREELEVGGAEATYTTSCFLNTKSHPSITKRLAKNIQPMTGSIKVIPKYFDTVEEGKMVYISELLYMKAVIGERFKQTGKCRIRAVPIDFCAAYFSIALSKNFPKKVKLKLNEKLYKFSEGGLYRRSFIKSTLEYDRCSQAKDSTSTSLSLRQLTGAFFLLTFGIGTSTIVFILEMALFSRNKQSDGKKIIYVKNTLKPNIVRNILWLNNKSC